MVIVIRHRAIVPAVLIALVLAGGPRADAGAPTVGEYDENIIQPNMVDFVATGSTVTYSQFKTRVAAAYAQELGGVINGHILSGYYDFGAQASKTLKILPSENTNWGIGAPTTNPIPISEYGAFASTGPNPKFTSLVFLNIQNGLPDEHVVEFGLTVLSVTGSNYGNVVVTGRVDGGGSVVATRVINDASGAGDTFFGLTAPAGHYFTGFRLTYDGPSGSDVRLWFDDVGFITPEPGTLGLIVLAGLVGLRRRRVFQKYDWGK